MSPIQRSEKMGHVTTTIIITNLVDEILAERNFITADQIRSVTLENVLVDTGATRLCLPANIIAQLGLPFDKEIETKTAAGVKKARLFDKLRLTIEGRKGVFNCLELPGGQDPLIGVIPLEDLGLRPDLKAQKLIVLPEEGENIYHLIY